MIVDRVRELLAEAGKPEIEILKYGNDEHNTMVLGIPSVNRDGKIPVCALSFAGLDVMKEPDAILTRRVRSVIGELRAMVEAA